MREQLQSILANFDYFTALEWFKSHVTGKYFVKELLSKGEDQYNRTKLITELRAIEETFVQAKPEDLINPTVESRHAQLAVAYKGRQESKKTRVIESAAPTLDLALLDEEWKPKYKEANHYFERLEFLHTEEERKEAAFRILDLMDEVEQIWRKKDFIKQFGTTPDFPNLGIEALSTAQMVTRINTLRSYISKANKGKLSKDKIPTWEAEKSELERRVRG